MAKRVRLPRRVRLPFTAATVAVGLLASGCGGTSSSGKRAYCDHLDTLKHDVSSLNVTGGLDSVRGQLSSIESHAHSLVASAKGDFPQKTSALDEGVTQLKASVKAAGTAPNAAQLAAVTRAIRDTAIAVSDIASTTKSKCS